MPTSSPVASCIIGIPRIAAICAATSLPEGAEAAMMTPSETRGLRAAAQAPLSKLLKQSPLTPITLETPLMEAAAVVPNPPGHSTVGVPPMAIAAPTSCDVTG